MGLLLTLKVVFVQKYEFISCIFFIPLINRTGNHPILYSLKESSHIKAVYVVDSTRTGVLNEKNRTTF